MSSDALRAASVAALSVFIGACALFDPAPQEDPVLVKLAELERRLASIERIVDNQSLVQLTQQVSALERLADQLQGRTEELQFDTRGAAERQRILYSDLDARIQELERSLQARGGNVLDGGRLPPGQLPVPNGTDRDNYQVAFELLKDERYDLAAASFTEFLAAFPDSELVDNAQYWLAESHYASNEFEEALVNFQVVIDKHPGSSKVPDALLKLGLSNYNLQRWDAARAALTQVLEDYAETTAARLAGQYLDRMQTEGV